MPEPTAPGWETAEHYRREAVNAVGKMGGIDRDRARTYALLAQYYALMEIDSALRRLVGAIVELKPPPINIETLGGSDDAVEYQPHGMHPPTTIAPGGRTLENQPYAWICGLLDDTEINHPDDARAYGPFPSYEAAKEVARTLSTDPDEAVVIPLIYREASE